MLLFCLLFVAFWSFVWHVGCLSVADCKVTQKSEMCKKHTREIIRHIREISIKSTNSVNKFSQQIKRIKQKINGHLWSFMLNHHIKQAIHKISVIRI